MTDIELNKDTEYYRIKSSIDKITKAEEVVSTLKWIKLYEKSEYGGLFKAQLLRVYINENVRLSKEK